MFGVYIICLTYFLFFAESTGRTFEGRTYHYNLELFKEIRRFIVYRHSLGTKAVLLNLLGNIVAYSFRIFSSGTVSQVPFLFIYRVFQF